MNNGVKDTNNTSEAAFKEVEILLPDHVKGGAFANNAVISHTPEEFVLDFMAIAPTAGAVVSRIFLTPGHTKRLLEALRVNVERYEASFGRIKEDPTKQS